MKNPILLIIKREFMTRVRKRAFIIATILTPILFGCITILPTWLATQDQETKQLLLLDDSGFFYSRLPQDESLKIIPAPSGSDLVTLKNELISQNTSFDGLVYIPVSGGVTGNKEEFQFFMVNSINPKLISNIRNKLQEATKELRLTYAGIDRALLREVNQPIPISIINLSEGEDSQSSIEAGVIVGGLAAFLIYMLTFLYGSQVMRGISEEKTNKIIEVIISSVKPFQLMLGKIIGIGLVGLLQFCIWMIGVLVISSVIQSWLGISNEAMTATNGGQLNTDGMTKVFLALSNLNIPLILFAFTFYFLGGYLLYAALFAIVGAAANSPEESQQFAFPATMPLIIAIVFLSSVLNDPDSNIAFWMSIIPFTSPIIMMVRVPIGVPIWQLTLSMTLLFSCFIFMTWVAGRIYRVGILRHGSKVSYQTLVKWFFMKE